MSRAVQTQFEPAITPLDLTVVAAGHPAHDREAETRPAPVVERDEPVEHGVLRAALEAGTVVDHLLSVRASSAAETHVVLVAPTIRDPALHLVEGLVGSGRSVLVIGVATTDDDVEALARTPVTGAQLVDLRPGERLVAALARRLGAAA
jgi:hypothetical protein